MSSPLSPAHEAGLLQGLAHGAAEQRQRLGLGAGARERDELLVLDVLALLALGIAADVGQAAVGGGDDEERRALDVVTGAELVGRDDMDREAAGASLRREVGVGADEEHALGAVAGPRPRQQVLEHAARAAALAIEDVDHEPAAL